MATCSPDPEPSLDCLTRRKVRVAPQELDRPALEVLPVSPAQRIMANRESGVRGSWERVHAFCVVVWNWKTCSSVMRCWCTVVSSPTLCHPRSQDHTQVGAASPASGPAPRALQDETERKESLAEEKEKALLMAYTQKALSHQSTAAPPRAFASLDGRKTGSSHVVEPSVSRQTRPPASHSPHRAPRRSTLQAPPQDPAQELLTALSPGGRATNHPENLLGGRTHQAAAGRDKPRGVLPATGGQARLASSQGLGKRYTGSAVHTESKEDHPTAPPEDHTGGMPGEGGGRGSPESVPGERKYANYAALEAGRKKEELAAETARRIAERAQVREQREIGRKERAEKRRKIRERC